MPTCSYIESEGQISEKQFTLSSGWYIFLQPEKVLLWSVSKSIFNLVIDHPNSGSVHEEPLCLHPIKPDLKGIGNVKFMMQYSKTCLGHVSDYTSSVLFPLCGETGGFFLLACS